MSFQEAGLQKQSLTDILRLWMVCGGNPLTDQLRAAGKAPSSFLTVEQARKLQYNPCQSQQQKVHHNSRMNWAVCCDESSHRINLFIQEASSWTFLHSVYFIVTDRLMHIADRFSTFPLHFGSIWINPVVNAGFWTLSVVLQRMEQNVCGFKYFSGSGFMYQDLVVVL